MTTLALAAAILFEGVVALYSRDGFGRGCPISPTTALTAEHVSSQQHRRVPLIYSDGTQAGRVREVDEDPARDLSLVKLTFGPKFRIFFQLAQKGPAVGDKVTLVGYNEGKVFVPRVVEAKILAVDGPWMSYDKTPGPGSSGSCVFNEAGEVVAVNVAGVELPGKVIGLGVAVWGEWGKFPTEAELEVQE